MAVKIQKEVRDDSLPLSAVPSGGIFQIVASHATADIGKIAQRWGDDMIHLGSGTGWSKAFVVNPRPEIRVRILAPGTTLVIE
jgi:hypothetical protein